MKSRESRTRTRTRADNVVHHRVGHHPVADAGDRRQQRAHLARPLPDGDAVERQFLLPDVADCRRPVDWRLHRSLLADRIHRRRLAVRRTVLPRRGLLQRHLLDRERLLAHVAQHRPLHRHPEAGAIRVADDSDAVRVLGGVHLGSGLQLLLPAPLRRRPRALLPSGAHVYHRLAPAEGLLHHVRPAHHCAAAVGSCRLQLVHVHAVLRRKEGVLRAGRRSERPAGALLQQLRRRRRLRCRLATVVCTAAGRAIEAGREASQHGHGQRARVATGTALLSHVARRRQLLLEVRRIRPA